MLENDGQAGLAGTEGGGAAAPAAAITPAPESYINPDGTLREGWINALDEDVRGEPSLKSFKKWQDGFKSFVTTKRMVGKNKIAIPGDTATQADWNEFYRAAGRPETPEDYGFKKPEEFPDEYYDPAFTKAAQGLFHKIGVSQKQAKAIFDFYTESAMKGIQAQQVNTENELNEIKNSLQQEWGQAYDQKLHFGNAAIEEGSNGNDEFKDRIVAKFGNDPDFIRFAANLGSKFKEDGLISAAIATPSDIQSQIDDLMHGDAYLNAKHPSHKITVQKVARLFEQKNLGRK